MSKSQKCICCTYIKPTKDFFLGICTDCQKRIADHSLKHHDKWCREEALKMEERRNEAYEERANLVNANLGLELIQLLQKVLK